MSADSLHSEDCRYMADSPSSPSSRLRNSEKLIVRGFVKGDHGDGSETASTASSEAQLGAGLGGLTPTGFGGFGPGGSWFWSPSSGATSGDSSPMEPGLLDCLEPWAFSDGHQDILAGSVDDSKDSNRTTKEEDASPLSGSLWPEPRRATVLTTSQTDGLFNVQWRVDSKKLTSKDKKAVSPSFDIELEGSKVGSFRIILTPCMVSQERSGACFRRARGWGRVEIKNESREGLQPLVLQASLWFDNGQQQIPVKRAEKVRHDFSEICVCEVSDEWDFSAAVDQASQVFGIHLVAFAEKRA